MTHEPECGDYNDGIFMPYYRMCVCEPTRAAYQRGVDSVTLTVVNDMYRKGYTAGYNDHAASRAHAEAMHGTYPMSDRLGTFDRSRWNQHGKGENP